MTMAEGNNLSALIKKGDGVLTKRGNVWTYPGAPNDMSGTNLVMPLEYVSDAEVQAALADGTLRAAVTNPTGFVSSVRMMDDETPAITAGLAGTPEMGTELPPNSRVEHDAGSSPMSAADAERATTDNLRAAATAPRTNDAKASDGKAGDARAKR
jgi:hypothetical protein